MLNEKIIESNIGPIIQNIITVPSLIRSSHSEQPEEVLCCEYSDPKVPTAINQKR